MKVESVDDRLLDVLLSVADVGDGRGVLVTPLHDLGWSGVRSVLMWMWLIMLNR